MKTKRFAMKPMTTDEAILQMDLLGHAFFFFDNADSGAAARRSTGAADGGHRPHRAPSADGRISARAGPLGS